MRVILLDKLDKLFENLVADAVQLQADWADRRLFTCQDLPPLKSLDRKLPIV